MPYFALILSTDLYETKFCFYTKQMRENLKYDKIVNVIALRSIVKGSYRKINETVLRFCLDNISLMPFDMFEKFFLFIVENILYMKSIRFIFSHKCISTLYDVKDTQRWCKINFFIRQVVV